MGMGYGANYADVVEQDFVKKTCPKEYAALDKAIDNDVEDFEAFAQEINQEGLQDIAPSIRRLSIGYHSTEDNGDRYDEIDGAYWSVEGVWTRTPAGKKFKTQIERKFFVTFG